MQGSLAHGFLPVDEIWSSLASYGTDWLYIVVPVLLAGTRLLALTRSGRRSRAAQGYEAGDALDDFGAGASRFFGLPSWVAGPLAATFALGLVPAITGFLWDVSWHISRGRDEFLFSPPHVAILIALLGFVAGGAISVALATRDEAPGTWHVHRWRVPPAAAGLLAAGMTAVMGWSVDELWHRSYGLDVTMWSPPHTAMISSATFAPLALIALYASVPASSRRWVRAIIPGFLSGVLLISLSAWQLEFDLGMPQWQLLYQPILIVFASVAALVIAQEFAGRGGALMAVAWFIAVRLGVLALVEGVWQFGSPRFPMYVGSALLVEVVYLGAKRWNVWQRAVAIGALVSTVGLATEAAWGQTFFHYPWTARLFPAVVVVIPLGIATAVIATAIGRAVVGQSVPISRRGLVTAVLAMLLVAAFPVQRPTPDGTVTAVAEVLPGGDTIVIRASLDPPDLSLAESELFVMSWQGGGRYVEPLLLGEGGLRHTENPIPFGGNGKTMIIMLRGHELGAMPLWMPADPAIAADAISLPTTARTATWDQLTDVLLREAHDGPLWPAVVTYLGAGSGIALQLGLTLWAIAGLRRRDESESMTPVPQRPRAIVQ